MIVTIGGEVASGKSTLAKKLAKRLGVKHISAGAIMRELASEKKMSLLEFSKYAESHPEIDKLIDERQKELASHGDCVVEGRVSAHIIPADFKVWLKADISERVLRARGRGDGDVGLVDAINLREASERRRYKEFYGIDLDDFSVFDLVLDTTQIGIEQMVDIVENQVRKLL